MTLQVTRYLGYSSLKDFFPTMDIKPNPGCVNSACRKMQQTYQQQQASPAAQQQRQAAAQAAQQQDEEPASHTDNEWGIEVVPEAVGTTPAQADRNSSSAATQQASSGSRQSYSHALPEGLQYSLPVIQQDCFRMHCLIMVLRFWLIATSTVVPVIVRSSINPMQISRLRHVT